MWMAESINLPNAYNFFNIIYIKHDFDGSSSRGSHYLFLFKSYRIFRPPARIIKQTNYLIIVYFIIF